MNVLFLGKFDHSSSNIPMLDVFRKRWSVDTFDLTDVSKKSLFGSVVGALSLGAYRIGLINERFLSQSHPRKRRLAVRLKSHLDHKHYDLIIISKGEDLDSTLIRQQKQRGCIVWYYFMDPLWVAKRLSIQRWGFADIFNVTFSDVIVWLASHGVTGSLCIQGQDTPLACGRNQSLGYRKKDIEILFFGSRNPHRSRVVNMLRRADLGVVVAGKGWEEGRAELFGEALEEIMSRSKIILNLSNGGSGFSRRVVMAYCQGCIVVSESIDDLKLYFENGNGIWWAPVSDLATLCRALIKNFHDLNPSFDVARFSWQRCLAQEIRIVEDIFEINGKPT